MSDDTAARDRLTAQQYRERANLIRRQAATMDGTVRRQLLALADQFDHLADSIEPSRWGGSRRTDFRIGETHMAGRWFVQPYHGGKVEAERPCTGCGEVVARVKKFLSTNTNPNVKLRVHVPTHATDDERREIAELGVESI
jgi:hypothetical protein